MAFGKFVTTSLVLILCLFAVLSVAAPRKGLSRKVLRAGNEIGSSTISKITLPSSSALRKARSSGATNIRAISRNSPISSTSSSGSCDFCQFCNTWDDDMAYKNFGDDTKCKQECPCENLEPKIVGANLNKTSVCVWPVVAKQGTGADESKTHLCMDTANLLESDVGKASETVDPTCSVTLCKGASDGQKTVCQTAFKTNTTMCEIKKNAGKTYVCFNREIHSTVWKEDWWKVYKVTWTDQGCGGTVDSFISIPHTDRLFQTGQCSATGTFAYFSPPTTSSGP